LVGEVFDLTMVTDTEEHLSGYESAKQKLYS